MRTRPLHKGTIIGLYRTTNGGIAMLAIEDEKWGKTLVPCYGKTTVEAFDKAFGGVIVGGRFENDAIVGEPIFYRIDELGYLCQFGPANEETPPELVAEYAKSAKEKPAPRKSGHIGFVEPDDPRIKKETEPSKPGTHTRGGFLPEDHPLYGAGPIVAGRRIFEPPKKSHENN